MEISIAVSDNDPDAPTWKLENDLQGKATVLDFKTYIQRSQWMIAGQVLEEEQAKGFDKEPRVRTDNKWGKDPRNVKFMGKIEFFSRRDISESLIDAYELVRERSVVVSGQYLASHYVFLNGTKIAMSASELKMWLATSSDTLKDGDKIRIVNVTPYAARIEIRGGRKALRGKNKGRNQSMQKNSFGSGVYALAARAINTRYKAQGKIKFEMIPNGYAGVYVEASARFRNSYIDDNIRGNRRNRFNGPYVYPSITFTISGEGILQ